jgi:hypothetical protein
MKENIMLNFAFKPLTENHSGIGFLEIEVNGKLFRFYDTDKYPDMAPVAVYEKSEFFEDAEYCFDETETLLEMIK